MISNRYRIAIFSLSFLVSLRAGGPAPPELFSVPMLECGGLPCVDATVSGGRTLRMLMDTGNVNSMIDVAKATSMGLERTPLMGRDGKPVARYDRSVLPGLKLGTADL